MRTKLKLSALIPLLFLVGCWQTILPIAKPLIVEFLIKPTVNKILLDKPKTEEALSDIAGRLQRIHTDIRPESLMLIFHDVIYKYNLTPGQALAIQAFGDSVVDKYIKVYEQQVDNPDVQKLLNLLSSIGRSIDIVLYSTVAGDDTTTIQFDKVIVKVE